MLFQVSFQSLEFGENESNILCQITNQRNRFKILGSKYSLLLRPTMTKLAMLTLHFEMTKSLWKEMSLYTKTVAIEYGDQPTSYKQCQAMLDNSILQDSVARLSEIGLVRLTDSVA